MNARRDGDYRCDHRSRWGTQPADVLDYRHGSNCNLADGSTAFALDTSKVEIGEEEAHRLQQEEQASRSFIKTSTVCLCPGGANVQLAAQLVSHMAHQNDMEVTALFAVSDKKPKHGATNTANMTVQLRKRSPCGRRCSYPT